MLMNLGQLLKEYYLKGLTQVQAIPMRFLQRLHGVTLRGKVCSGKFVKP